MVVPPSLGGSSAQAGPAPARAPSRPNGISSASIPLSVRRSAPLDLSTIERRRPSSANRDAPKRVRPHGLLEAPTYRPTEEEFKDPMKYVEKIAPEASKYGICRIIPPDAWNPPFAINTEKFHFRTRRQELNSVEGGTRANLNYLDQLAKFHKQHGTNLNRFPSVDKRPLDLYKLKKAVEVRGGFDKVCKLKKWAEIGRDLGYSGKIMSSLSTSLKNSYQRWLHPYEEYLRVAKPGVQQQLEFEYGGPYTPSPGHSPMKRSHSQQATPSNIPSESPAMRATAALNISMGQPQTEMMAEQPRPMPMPVLEAPRPISSSGFTAVNNGFAAVNAPSSGFVAVNNGPPAFVKREPEAGTSTPKLATGTPFESTKNTPEYSSSGPGQAHLTNGHASNPMKRTISHESLNGDSQTDGANGNSEEDGSNGRRSKRLKRDAAPTVAGSHMSMLRPSTPRMRMKSAGIRTPGEKCENCGKTEDRESIIACDSCDVGYHKYCLDPPLTTIPDYDWHCPKCLVGTGEYGFEEGGIYSLKQFQEKANNFKEHYFAPKMAFDPVTGRRRETEDDVEREFWRLVESLTETVEVEYGADIHSTTHGSGFPTVETNPLDPYSRDSWNLNNMPLHEESLFRHIKSDISGMTVPWLYVGMCFSTFCWHNEDHYTYSANYQHFGATKTWYGIPGADAEAFEEAMRQAVPELFETQPDLLFQLVTLLPPDQLRKAGVNVYALDQRAGQFVITFPQAYHAGFNHGFNFNEAVNFAPSDWEPFGEAGVGRLQEFRRQPCFSHDELLLTAAARDSSIKTAKWLAPALERMRDRELQSRRAYAARHKDAFNHTCKVESTEGGDCKLPLYVGEEDLPEEEYQCYYCKAYCFLSHFRCLKSAKTVCLAHAETFDCCGTADVQAKALCDGSHMVQFRLTNDSLINQVQKVVDKSQVPELWQERLDNLLEGEAKPPLKAMHTLLTEGDKIPVHLPGLDDLSHFVQRCDKWVEEANNFITRKQQNRRKNEKAWRKTSAKAAQVEEREKDLRSVDRILVLLNEADALCFDCPQLETLRERHADIETFRHEARTALKNPGIVASVDFEKLIETGKGFNVDIEELVLLEKGYQQIAWNEQAIFNLKQKQSLDDTKAFVDRAAGLGIPEDNVHLLELKALCHQGDIWEKKAKDVMNAESIHYPQLDSLYQQAVSDKRPFPVNHKTMADMDAILTRNREAHKRIMTLVSRSQDADFKSRPTYTEVRNQMEALNELNSKPHGTMELEREQKRHEDWMRKGKKLFGKANAPLHILKSHMQTVQERNDACFDLADRCRPPVEPASRDVSPDNAGAELGTLGRSSKDVFCICRQPEAGMMIECEVCHEWYHGKCLKIARGKMKEAEVYTCPICDWRVKIPRDAARPKLEDLMDWQCEISGLPFQPEEEEVLDKIVSTASAFREHVQPLLNGGALMTSEEIPEMLFYLRKIEGADILLAFETNYFRQELHKWNPIAPVPPPILEHSLSTRKPRPTKLQKTMAQLGVEKPEDLPPHLRGKPGSIKRKNTEPHAKQPPPLQPAMGYRSNTPSGGPRSASTGNAPSAGLDHIGRMNFSQSPQYPANFSAAPTSGSPIFPSSSAFVSHSPVMNPVLTQADPHLFSPRLTGADDDTLRPTASRLTPPTNPTEGINFGSSPTMHDNDMSDMINYDSPVGDTTIEDPHATLESEQSLAERALEEQEAERIMDEHEAEKANVGHGEASEWFERDGSEL